jgi:hypothetical protein
MESPILTYQQNKANSAKIRGEFNRLFNDIYYNGSKRSEKNDLGNTNEEKEVLQLGKFIPGKIYTFDYTPLYPDVLAFYDRRPLIFVNTVFRAQTTQNDIVTGINLNFLPELARAQTLDTFWKNFKSEIQQSEKRAEEGAINLAINRIISFFRNWTNVLKVYNGSSGLGYQYAYRNYAIQQIKNLRYVEYQHWEAVPFLAPEKFIGASIAEVHSKYWSSQKTLNEKKSGKR